MRRALASLCLAAAAAGCTLVVDGDPPRACTSGSTTVPSGAVIEAGDGCNRCTCRDGALSCTDAPCEPPLSTCTFGDVTYLAGERFPVDACNTCLCQTGGELVCTATECVPEGCVVMGEHLRPGETLVDGPCTWTCGEDGTATSRCGPEGCTYAGRSYRVSETFPGDDGTTCTCKAPEQVECVPVSPLCTYLGETYLPGEVFAMSDGCNRCRCTETGALTCTSSTCESVQDGYFELPSVRVAFVVSNAVGAASLQEAIGDHAPEILAPGDDRGLLRILAVTSTGAVPDPACTGAAQGAENGRFVPLQGPRFFDPDAPEPVGLAFLLGALEACHHVEEGIASALRATSRILAGDDDPATPLPRDGNGRFALEGKVATVFATSGDDVTQGELEALARELRQVRGDRLQNQLSFHLLVGPPGEPCESRNAIRYRQLVELLGGTVEYACTGLVERSPWKALGEAAFHYDVRVLLEDVPHDVNGDGEITEAAGEIEIFVDGARYPAVEPGGTMLWRYEPAAVAVDFTSGHVPLPGSPYEIHVRTAPPDP